MSVKWHGPAVVLKITKKMERIVDSLADHGAVMLRDKLNIPFPRASRPGEFPRKRTGNLRDSIKSWHNYKGRHFAYYTAAMGYDMAGYYGKFLVQRLGRRGPWDVLGLLARHHARATP